MNIAQIYIAVALIVLAVIAVLVFFVSKTKSEKKLTPLIGLAFGFIVAGIVFGEDRLIGYSLMGVGVILAIIDSLIVKKLMSS